MRISILAFVLLAACGSDSNTKTDAAGGLDGNGSGSGSGSGAVLSCADYCSQIGTACTGANQQFNMPNQCMSTCSHYAMGTAGETTGNTLACRSYHVGVAASDPNTHCIHAGPSGGGACGSSCESFCSLVTAVCSAQYPDMGTCMTQCAGFNMTKPYSSMVQSGDSFACRMYHATAAAQNPATHCPHTAPTATAPCTGMP